MKCDSKGGTELQQHIDPCLSPGNTDEYIPKLKLKAQPLSKWPACPSMMET